MLTRIYNKITFECDSCSDTFDTDTNDLDAAMIRLRREGWAAKKVDDTWHHYCAHCEKNT